MPKPAAQIPSLEEAAWLRADATQAVLRALEQAGHQARVVGGAVRNALMGKPVTDVDIATTATPEQTAEAARAAGLRAVPTGIAHGTMTIIAAHVPFEVTTLRRDVATDGRRATVSFAADWSADAMRRDFTINALYCDRTGHVHDLVEGYPDVMAGRVRFIGSAHERISEDYLRILRFFRFLAQYGREAPDAAGLHAAVELRSGLDRLSRERIHGELAKLIAAPGALPAVELMTSHGILTQCLAFAPRPGVLARLLAVERGVVALDKEPHRRLAALLIAVGEDAGRLGARLRVSSEQQRTLTDWAAGLDGRSGPPGATLVRTLVYRLGNARAMTRLLAAMTGGPADLGDPGWREALAMARGWQAPALPVDGSDALAAGIPKGPKVGRLMALFEDWWLAADCPTDRELALARLRKLATIA